jgi:hypothetical protein
MTAAGKAVAPSACASASPRSPSVASRSATLANDATRAASHVRVVSACTGSVLPTASSAIATSNPRS